MSFGKNTGSHLKKEDSLLRKVAPISVKSHYHVVATPFLSHWTLLPGSPPQGEISKAAASLTVKAPTNCTYCEQVSCLATSRNECSLYRRYSERAPRRSQIGIPTSSILTSFSAAGTLLWSRYADGEVRVGVILERGAYNFPGGKRNILAENPTQTASRELFKRLRKKIWSSLPPNLSASYADGYKRAIWLAQSKYVLLPIQLAEAIALSRSGSNLSFYSLRRSNPELLHPFAAKMMAYVIQHEHRICP